jgi:hypothetical protein
MRSSLLTRDDIRKRVRELSIGQHRKLELGILVGIAHSRSHHSPSCWSRPARMFATRYTPCISGKTIIPGQQLVGDSRAPTICGARALVRTQDRGGLLRRLRPRTRAVCDQQSHHAMGDIADATIVA